MLAIAIDNLPAAPVSGTQLKNGTQFGEINLPSGQPWPDLLSAKSDLTAEDQADLNPSRNINFCSFPVANAWLTWAELAVCAAHLKLT